MIKRLLKEYEYELKAASGLSKHSIAAYLKDAHDYVVYLIDIKGYDDVKHIQTKDVQNYFMTLRKKHYAAATFSRKRSAIKRFHQFLVDERLVDDNIFMDLPKQRRKQHLPTVLSIEECERLLSVYSEFDTPLKKRNQAMLEMLYGSGLRISELIGLTLDQVYVQRGLIRVLGKGQKERMLPLGSEAQKALRDYLADGRMTLLKTPTDAVFLNRFGKPISRVGFFKIIKELAQEAGIDKNVSPHTLRHSFATHLLERGVGLRYVQELLGHRDVSTTEIYTHVTHQQLQHVFDTYHPLKRSEEDDN